MKKYSKECIWRRIVRIGLKFILSTCISIIFIYLLIGDDEVFKVLFSSEKTAEIILLASLTWFFGTFVGGLIASVEFIKLLDKRNIQLEEKQLEINNLKKKLNKFSKKSSSSFADRVFTEIEGLNDVDKSVSDTIDTDFKTLQELQASQHNFEQQ